VIKESYTQKLKKTTNYKEHVEIWKKIIRGLKSKNTFEKLIVDSENYYFNSGDIRKLYNGSKHVKGFGNPYIIALFELENRTGFFSTNPTLISKYDKYLKSPALRIDVLMILPIEIIDYYKEDLNWDMYIFIFIVFGVEHDDRLKIIMQKYENRIMNVREYEPNTRFRLFLRKISLGLFTDINELSTKFMDMPASNFKDEDLIQSYRQYFYNKELDLKEIRKKYFEYHVDFINEKSFELFFELIKTDSNLSSYLLVKIFNIHMI